MWDCDLENNAARAVDFHCAAAIYNYKKLMSLFFSEAKNKLISFLFVSIILPHLQILTA